MVDNSNPDMELRKNAKGRDFLFWNLKHLKAALVGLSENNVTSQKPKIEKCLENALSWEWLENLEA